MTTALVSCASLSENRRTVTQREIEVNHQFERIKEIISIIQSEYFEPTSVDSLWNAGERGLYQGDDSSKFKVASVSRGFFNDSMTNFKREYYYLAGNNLKPSNLIDHAISSVADSLGPDSFEFIHDNELQELRAGTNPLGGIGLQLTKVDENIVIVDTFDKSPAQRLGLLSGDYLLKIDDKPVQNQPLKDVTRGLRGLPGSVVQLTVEHDGKVIVVTATREVVDASFIKSTLYPEGIGYIRISAFYPSIREQFDKHFADLVSANGSELQGLILDLRNNSGGELSSIIDIAETFLDDGVILSTDGRGDKMDMRFLASKQPNDIGSTLKLVVLINGETGSGAAMLAAVLQDRDRGLIMGTATADDYSIRSVYKLKSGGALKLKNASMSLPSGNWLGGGVTPNFCVSGGKMDLYYPRVHNSTNKRLSCPKETKLPIKEENDFILQGAFKVLLGKVN
jgi:carboxyl-terminal processing protease